MTLHCSRKLAKIIVDAARGSGSSRSVAWVGEPSSEGFASVDELQLELPALERAQHSSEILP